MGYDQDYFARYDVKNMLGRPIGERRFFYDFWERYLGWKLRPGVTVLEVACGPGFLLQRLKKKYNAFAMDISHAALQQTRERTGHTGLFQADAQKIPLQDESLDCLVAFDLIEHLETPRQFFNMARTLLKPGGLMVIATPNPQSLGCQVKQGRIPDDSRPWEERMQQWHGWRDDTHINITPIDEWRNQLRDAGFTIVRDGSDFWWDTPYFNWIPLIVQKLLFNGVNRLITYGFGFMPWKRGENYYAVVRRK